MSDIFYDKTATIWNKTETGPWEEETWFPTVVHNVRILTTQGTNIMKSGDQNASKSRLHISDLISISDKPYTRPEEWIPGESYTLDDKSYFSEGDTSSEEPTQEFFARSDVFHISAVDRYYLIPHWEIWGR